MSFSVIIPSYRRPTDLRRCLEGLARQSVPPDEVIVAVRASDDATSCVLIDSAALVSNLRQVVVSPPGVVAAMSAGLAAVRTDITGLIDDDAVAEADWVRRMLEAFEGSPRVAGVGGRDRLRCDGRAVGGGAAPLVGKVQWFGRHIGNHHIGVGPPRDVDVLKGVNCAYRTSLLRDVGFETRLLGSGAQVHWELCLGLALRRAGWRLVYDPAIVVDHFPAQRFDEDQRHRFSYEARFNEAHNETLALLSYLPPVRRAVFALWSVVVGTRAVPGVLQLVRLSAARHPSSVAHWRAALAGRVAGWRTWRQSRSRWRHPAPPPMLGRA